MTEDKLSGHDIFPQDVLLTKMSIRDIHNLIRDVKRSQRWSKLAAIDIRRLELFSYQPIWCVDFSEIRVFLEKNEQQPSALHLIDYIASGRAGENIDEELMIMPGTVFEILTFLDNLVRKSTHSQSILLSDFKQDILSAANHKIAGQLILNFITEHSEKRMGEAIKTLKRTEPAVLRLQYLLESKHVKFFHRAYGDIVNSFQWFPGYFENVYQGLHQKRDKLTINNYNDALNLSLCFSLNENNIDQKGLYFVYVTRDRACIDVANQYPWRGDPMKYVDPLERIPLCREPYSVFLYYGDKKGEEKLADDLSLSCRNFVSKLKRLPEYLDAIKETRNIREKLESTLIEFNPAENRAHKDLSQTLQLLMQHYGSLLYKAIEEADFQKLRVIDKDKYASLRLGEFPQRQLSLGTRSLEKLTAALGLVYREVTSQQEGAAVLVETILHTKAADLKIKVIEEADPDFNSRSFALKTTVGREAVICIIELYNHDSEDFFYSAWWSSAANINLFADVVNFYWNTIRKKELASSSDERGYLLKDDEKIFETGLTLVVPKIIDGQIDEEIISEPMPDLMPLSEADELLRGYIEQFSPYSLRVNTRAGDIWVNFSTSSNTVPRMGIISHIWEPELLAKVVAFTSNHYVAVTDLEKILGGLK